MKPWYDGYWWQWVIQNILPTVVCSAAAVAFAVIFRARVARWWHQLVGDRADIEDLRRAAAAAQRIAADLFEHHTGERHSAAPDHESEAK